RANQPETARHVRLKHLALAPRNRHDDVPHERRHLTLGREAVLLEELRRPREIRLGAEPAVAFPSSGNTDGRVLVQRVAAHLSAQKRRNDPVGAGGRRPQNQNENENQNPNENRNENPEPGTLNPEPGAPNSSDDRTHDAALLYLLPACGVATYGNTCRNGMSFPATPSPRTALMPPLNDGVSGVAPAITRRAMATASAPRPPTFRA